MPEEGEHSTDEDQGAVEEFPGRKTPPLQFDLNTAEDREALGTDEPRPKEADGWNEHHRREGAHKAPVTPPRRSRVAG